MAAEPHRLGLLTPLDPSCFAVYCQTRISGGIAAALAPGKLDGLLAE